LHILRKDEKVRAAAHSWLEHCEWIPALLSGVQDVNAIKRSRCAAGHKAMWHPNWGGLPAESFLVKLDPVLSGVRERLYTDTYTSDELFGTISAEWAQRLGLSNEVKIGVGAFDAHLGAVGGEIKPYYLSKVMGTSTCDMLVAPASELGKTLVKGICGQVDGSIIPGMIGLEAGQSAFGDVYAWFKNLLMWPTHQLLAKSTIINDDIKKQLLEEISDNLINDLSESAELIDPEHSGVLALDWLNGRRTPDANQMLTGAVTGLTLGTDAPAFFRALVEATAFGSKSIVERFKTEGVRIDGVIALGGVAKKSPLVMQIVADVLDMPIEVARHEQTCALGSAMAASVVAGIHPDFDTARKSMGHGFEKTYTPRPQFVQKYKALYLKYCELGEKMELMVKNH
jgi:L-ribulokinase